MNVTTTMKADVAQDHRFLNAALRLAKKHQGMTGTNPSVACVIVSFTQDGPKIIGSGVTAQGGRPHAETFALEEAGELARGATAYVTLEPCAHHGKTPPCAQTLIDAGIARVVTAITDPDQRVNGKGHQMLMDAGIEVVLMDGGGSAKRVLQGYLKARTSTKPFVTLKIAMTKQGIMGSKSRGNLRITSNVSGLQTHLHRARHDAILVGSGTALFDDPGLDCRLAGLKHRSPTRIILDEKSRLTEKHTVVKTALETPTIVVAPVTAPQEWRTMLMRNGVQFQVAEMDGTRIALPELMDDLAAKGIQSVMVEGGARIAESLVRDDLVDEIVIHVGGEAEVIKPGEEAIHAPFTPENLPTGFDICQELQFGVDRSLRIRKNCE